MDIRTCLKSLLLAIQQYRDNKSSQSTSQLQKQVEELSLLNCKGLLSSGQVLPSECVSGLVEVAGDPNCSPALTGTIISLLGQLACDDESRLMLHTSYNLTSSLSSIIHWHSTTPTQPLVLQCLQLLQKLTYNTRIFHSTNFMHELISFLMTNIQSCNDDIILPCLGLMANLCRDNPSIQNQIKSLENVKQFYRTLINFLDHKRLTVVVFSLSILGSLTLNEKVGEKLFDAKNIHQTFQLVFNILINGDGTLTRKYAVDLLVDLLKNPKMADYLTRYEHFTACVSQVLGLLHGKDPDSAAKVLELLLSVCNVSGLRSILCEVVFKPVGPKLRAASRRQGVGPDSGQKVEPGLALVQWLTSSAEGAESCCLQALQLLNELLEEALEAERVSPCVLSFVEMLLPVVLGLLKRGVDSSQGEVQLKKCCTLFSHVNDLLLILCEEDSTRCLVAQQLSAQLCLSLVESLLLCSQNSSPLTSPPPGTGDDLSQVCAEAILKTLELMSKLKQQVKDMESSFYKILQDQRMVTPFSLALTSNYRERVQCGLSLLFEATPLPDFPLLVLGESIAANNAYRQRDAEGPMKRVAVQEVSPLWTNSLSDSPKNANRSVNSLVERIQNGMELQEDAHVSQIIDVYEEKLSSLALKESRLQDLLEAKAMALSQADRLIAQYRFQRAQAEAETRKMGGLLKESERSREDLQAALAAQVLDVERSKADMKDLLQHNSRLQQDSQELESLKGAYSSLLSRFNDSECRLKELQAAHVSLTKQNDALRKNHETLRKQHEKTVSALEDRQEQIEFLQSDLQQRDGDIAGLKQELQAEENRGKEKEREKRELEETVDVLRKELNKTEQARKDASIKASSLELQKSQVEAKLKQKEDELNKHSAMIAMIHSLSSGKVKQDDVNLSL